MKKLFTIGVFVLSITLLSSNTPDPKVKGLSNRQIVYVLESEGTLSEESQDGYWELYYKDRTLIVITNETSDRIRVMTPVVEKKNIKPEQYFELLQAQYHGTLDVRYALHNDVLWSVYAHPLDDLTREELTNALSQVYYAAYNFGTTYLSTRDVITTQE